MAQLVYLVGSYTIVNDLVKRYTSASVIQEDGFQVYNVLASYLS